MVKWYPFSIESTASGHAIMAKTKTRSDRSISGLGRHGKDFVPPATITLPSMLSGGSDDAFREALYRMVFAFSRLISCREAFGRHLSMTASQFGSHE